MIIGSQPALLWFWFYWQLFGEYSNLFFLLFPFSFIIDILVLIFGTTIIAKFFLLILNKIHKPREGIFNRDSSNKDYCYWSLRAIIKKWPIWLARQLSVPIVEINLLRLFDVKVGKKCSLHEGWVDTEFIEVGDNVRIGKGSLIVSSLLVQDKLMLRRIKINNNIIIGAHSIILPGTNFGSNSILDANSLTKINQEIKEDAVYRGVPCELIYKKSIKLDSNTLKNEIFKIAKGDQYENIEFKEEKKELSVPFHLYITSGWFIIGFSFIFPGFLFYLYFFGFLEPNLFSFPLNLENLISPKSYIHLLLFPVILISFYLLHLFFVALFTKLFYVYADRRGPDQGIFDRNLDEESKALDYYHFRSFLFKYPIYAFIRSPFPWLINWELKFLGSNKVGKGTTIEESYLHSHISIGENCYLGTFTHLTNHLVDGVYGEENLTFFGTELKDNVIFEILTGALPGTIVGENSTFLPIGSTIKFDELLGNAIYTGFPAKKLDKKEIKQLIGEEYFNE